MAKSCEIVVIIVEKSCIFACEIVEKSCKMIDRKIISQFLRWKNAPDHKALLVKGARQVGKTTSIRAFGKAHYKHFVEINFEKDPTARDAFMGKLDERTIVLYLSAMGYGPFEKGETLIFFDEIQSCPDARTAIKFLIEDGSYDYIESGSLLGINYRDVSSFPVGFEEQVEMYPLDFEEFLWANGVSEAVVDSLRTSYERIEEVPDFLHRKMMEYLRSYLIVGGMPEAVSQYLRQDDLSQTDRVQSIILSGYRDDISKYAGNEKVLAKRVFDAIPQQLSKADKRFLLSALEDGASQRKFGSATQWLADAGIAYFSYNVRAFELPLAMSEKRNLYKFFLFDTGLLSHLCLKGIQFKVLGGDISINEGALTENFVASELVKHGHSLNYYDRKSKQELDFIYPEQNEITILEVKSGDNYRSHASLNAALKMFPEKIANAIVLSKYNVNTANGIVYYPLYMTMFL